MAEMETNESLNDIPIAQRKDRDKSLSPTKKEWVNHLIKDLKSKKASIRLDEKGNVSVDYKSEMKNVMVRKDKSQAEKIVCPKNKEEELAYVEAFSEIMAKMKELKSPSGVNLSDDEIYSRNGFYVEDKDFQKTGEILGKGISGNIFVVKDNKTGKEHALKTVLIAECREEELKMWIDLNEEDFVPSLLLVRRDKNKIHFHMEKLTEVITLRKVIDESKVLSEIDSDKIKGVSLCVLHGLLTAVNKIHKQKWTHNDLHAGNVMLQKKDLSIDIKIIDFGLGQRFERMTYKNEIGWYQSDIWSCFRLFSAMYLGEEFNNIKDVKNGLEKLTERFEYFDLPEEDRKEILQLYDVFLEITSTNSIKFGKTEKALENVCKVLVKNDFNKEEMLEYAAQKLFPDKITPVNSIDLTDSPREVVAQGGGSRECMVVEQGGGSRESMVVEQVGGGDTRENYLPGLQQIQDAFNQRESMIFKATGPGVNKRERETDRVNSVGSTNSHNAEIMRGILDEMSIQPRFN